MVKFLTSTGILDVAAADGESPTKTADPMSHVNSSVVDDEDDLLYGDSDVTIATMGKQAETEGSVQSMVQEKEFQTTYWAVLAWQHGNMEVESFNRFSAEI